METLILSGMLLTMLIAYLCYLKVAEMISYILTHLAEVARLHQKDIELQKKVLELYLNRDIVAKGLSDEDIAFLAAVIGRAKGLLPDDKIINDGYDLFQKLYEIKEEKEDEKRA